MNRVLILMFIIIYCASAQKIAAAAVNKVSTLVQSETADGKAKQTSYVAFDKQLDPYPYYTILHRGGIKAQNYIIPQLFSDRENRLQLSIHEAESGLGFSHQKNRVETMGSRSWQTSVRIVNPQHPMTFFINYVNEANYQALTCQNWQCTYQHKKNGRFIEELEQTMELTSFKNTPLADYESMSWSFVQYMTRVRILLTRREHIKTPEMTSDKGTLTNQMNIDLDAEQALPIWGDYRIEEYLSAEAGTGEVAGNQYLKTSTSAVHWTSDHLINRYYRQTDEDWANESLGHSDELTIGSDGCALTSALMLLEHYGHHTNFEKVSGQNRQINPALFNEWLKKRPYGFIEGVYLNWAEVAKFALESHNYYYAQMGPNLPKLEFAAVAGKNETEIKEEIKADLAKRQPMLLNIGGSFGHFNIAVNNHSDEPYDIFGEEDVVIADPYYSGWRSLEQIQEKGQHTLLGARRFVPSFTDLSYLWFYSFSDDLEIRLTNGTGETKLLEPWTDEISAPSGTGEKRVPLYQYTLAKPETETWEISIMNTREEEASVSALVYNSEAELLAVAEDIKIEAGGATSLELELQKDEKPSAGQITKLVKMEDKGQNENEGKEMAARIEKIAEMLEEALTEKKMRFYAYRTLAALVARAKEEIKKGELAASGRYLARVKWWLDYYEAQPRLTETEPLVAVAGEMWEHVEAGALIRIREEVEKAQR